MGELETQVRAQLDGWDLAETAEGTAALDVARRLDAPRVSGSAAALLHGQLRQYLADARRLAPQEETADAVDQVQAQRDKRRRAAGTA